MSERNNGGTLAPILLRQTAGYGGQALSPEKGEGMSPLLAEVERMKVRGLGRNPVGNDSP